MRKGALDMSLFPISYAGGEMPELNIGLMPDGGSTLFVPAAVGKARAFQMALRGERSTIAAPCNAA